MNNFYVYEYTRLDTNTVFYVGKGRGYRYKNVSDRNKYFINIVKTVPYKVELILEELSEKDAFEAEVSFIKYRKSIGQANCNFTDGGEGSTGVFFTQERRENMSLGKKKSGYKHSEETKQKMCGRKISDETRKKQSVSYGINSLERSKKMSEARKGQCWTQNRRDAQELINQNKQIEVFNKITGLLVGKWNTISKCAIDLKVKENCIYSNISGVSKSFGKIYTAKRLI